jgi:hypothetical protein
MKRALIFMCMLAGCVDTLPPIEEVTSLRVELTMPTDPGTKANRLPDTVTSAQIVVTALDAHGNQAALDGPVKVYAQFLGTVSPIRGTTPLATVMLSGGVSAPTTVNLPRVYGPTTLWVEDDREGGTYETGASPQLWFRDPYISDIVTPRDENALDALENSPLENKQVTVSASRYGANGRLVVQQRGPQGYWVADVMCADANGTPPCQGGDYDYLNIFSFSAPRDEMRRPISAGMFIDGFAGGVSEFNGLTEIGFPQSFITEASPITENLARLPTPKLFDVSWLSNVIMFERNESNRVQVNGGIVCELDADYDTYKQWKLDVGRGCGSPINVISGLGSTFNPADHVGMAVTSVIGVLDPVNIGTFNVWILKTGTDADITP